MNQNETSENKPPVVVKNIFNFESVTLRFIFVIAIIIGLMIPLFLVRALIAERESYYQQAEDNIAREWASQQTIVGPFITVRSTTAKVSEDDTMKTTQVDNHVAYMPTAFEISHHTTHEFRSRGIHKVPVFRVQAELVAEFSPIKLEQEHNDLDSVRIVIGLSDTVGIEALELLWNNESLTDFEVFGLDWVGPAVYVDVNPMLVSQGGRLEANLEFRGTSSFRVIPIGDQSTIHMTSDWPHPRFEGKPLPDEREVSADGFSATWTIHRLARGFPSEVTLTENTQSTVYFNRFTIVGYSALELHSPYRDLGRATVYGILFVVLTLVSILCIQLVSSARFHIVQYGVVGISLVLFFLTVLSLTEHVGFLFGYILAAILLTTMNTIYVWFITRQVGVTATIGIFLVLLYAALYLVLQLQTYALAIGTLLLLLLLSMLMYATRTLRASDENS